MTPHAWLKRLAFSFLMIGFVLFWRGQKQIQGGSTGVQPYLWLLGAGICVILGLIGVRLRHGPPRDGNQL